MDPIISRNEKLLMKILGQDVELEPPQSRIEALLWAIVEQGGVGGGAYEVKGSYNTYADLIAAHPTGNAGDAYLVGDPSHIYVWLTDSAEWHDGGAFSAVAGQDGVGIRSITKTGTSGLVDTYTIRYTNDTTSTFTVTNGEEGEQGNGIASIEKTSTSGLVDTYTITYTDGTTSTYAVTNGEKGVGIQSVTKTGTAGLVDTYTIVFTDGTYTTFTVTNAFSPTIEVKSSTSSEYILTITTKDATYDTPNLKGGGTGASTLAELDDVTLTNLRNGQIIKYNSTTQKWENSDGIEIDELADIGDVQISALRDGQTLVWDDTARKWVNKDAVNPTQFSTMPAAEDYPSAVVQFTGTSTADYKRGYFYRSTPQVISGELIYTWQQIDTQPSNADYETILNKPQINGVELTGDKTSDDLDLSDKLQFLSFPEPDPAIKGARQYIGATTAQYKKNYWYQVQYDSDSGTYIWAQVDVSDNAALASRVTALETNQGNMADLEVATVSSLVEAINAVNAKGSIERYVYDEPNLIIYYHDGHTFQISVGGILSETQIGELANVVDSTVADGQILQYDSSIEKYKPYAILVTLQNLLAEAKTYTDEEIMKAIQVGAYVCDEKPTLYHDEQTGEYSVIYKQNGAVKTTTNTSARFYYDDASGDPFCTSWIEGVEFTFSVAAVDFDEYVNKDTDVVSTYTEDMLDKSKIPDIAALDALLAIVKTALGLKVNTADIIDNLTSSEATKPLSAKQGKTLKSLIDGKQDLLQLSVMPVADVEYLGKTVQYVGSSSAAYAHNMWYECAIVAGSDPAEYEWVEVKYAADVDDHLDSTSHNPVENAVLTPELEKKAEQLTTIPTAALEYEGKIVQYKGVTTAVYTHGYFYECQLVDSNYEWVNLSVQKPVETATQNTLGVVMGGDGTSINASGGIDVVNRLEEIATLPTAEAANEGKCYLYKGSAAGYQNGGIYQCQEVLPATEPVTYTWALISANPMEAGAGITIEDDVIAADTNIFNGTLDEWEALTAEEQAQYSHIASPEEADITSGYSTTETKTGATWIDGKPIYRKVFHYDSITTTGDYLVENNIEHIVNQGGCQKYANTEIFVFPWIYSGGSGTERLYFIIKGNDLYRRVEYNNVTQLSDINWWVEYTKTTD